MAHTFNPRTWGTEGGGSLVILRPVWSTEQDLGAASPNDETLSQKNKKSNQTKQSNKTPLTNMQNIPPVSNLIQGYPPYQPIEDPSRSSSLIVSSHHTKSTSL